MEIWKLLAVCPFIINNLDLADAAPKPKTPPTLIGAGRLSTLFSSIPVFFEVTAYSGQKGALRGIRVSFPGLKELDIALPAKVFRGNVMSFWEMLTVDQKKFVEDLPEGDEVKKGLKRVKLALGEKCDGCSFVPRRGGKMLLKFGGGSLSMKLFRQKEGDWSVFSKNEKGAYEVFSPFLEVSGWALTPKLTPKQGFNFLLKYLDGKDPRVIRISQRRGLRRPGEVNYFAQGDNAMGARSGMN